MKLLARHACWWPENDDDIGLKSKHCPACVHEPSYNKRTCNLWLTSYEMWQRNHADYRGQK